MSLETTINHLVSTHCDPILHKTAQELGITPQVSIQNQHIHVHLLTPFPVGFIQQGFIPTLQKACESACLQHTVTITSEQRLMAHQTQLAGHGLRGVKNTIAIASGKGGVGKSTVTVQLAVTLARMGARVGILDADIYGPSIPMMLGASANVRVEDDRYIPSFAHGVQAMSMGYLTPKDDTALIWRGPMLAKSLIQMLDLTRWDDLDYLFIDLPPGTGDIQLSLVQKIPLTAAIIVTTPQPVATLDAKKALRMFETTNIHTLGIIENMSTHICTHCGHHEAIFGDGGAAQLAEQYHCPRLGTLPLDTRLRQQADVGNPSALHEFPDALAQELLRTAYVSAWTLSLRPLNYASKFPPIVAI